MIQFIRQLIRRRKHKYGKLDVIRIINGRKKIHDVKEVVPFIKRYFFDGISWYKQDQHKKLEKLNQEQIDIMKKNTIDGQWLFDGNFEHRDDIRTWVTEENWV